MRPHSRRPRKAPTTLKEKNDNENLETKGGDVGALNQHTPTVSIFSVGDVWQQRHYISGTCFRIRGHLEISEEANDMCRLSGLQLRLLAAATLVFTAISASNQTAPTEPSGPSQASFHKVILWMESQRGDAHYGPNFILLHRPCQDSRDGACECGMSFKALNSQEFADYISSFQDNRIPVTYDVFYDHDGRPGGSRLASVGTWSRDRFPVNDRLLWVNFKSLGGASKKRQEYQLHGSSECFPTLDELTKGS